MRFVPTLAASLALMACGYNYHLPGHGPGRTATVTLHAGETLPALTERIIPLKFGYQLSLSSEDPEVADVAFRGNPRRAANIRLVARRPGTTIVHYGNLFNQTTPFAVSESRRLGVSLPGLAHEEPGAARGWPRKSWLRQTSDAAFQVRILPAGSSPHSP